MHSQGDRTMRQLWGLAPAAAHGPKARWTLEDVARAAIALADESGLDALALAGVADRLGMTTTALYRYVDSKAALVEVMVDAAVGAPPTITGRDWRDRSRAWVRALAERYTAHPWLTDLRPTGMPRQPNAYAWIDALVRAIGDAHPDPLRVALLLDGLVRTYAGLASSMTGAGPEPWLNAAVAERFPALGDAAQQDVSDAGDELEFAVDAVLRGLG